MKNINILVQELESLIEEAASETADQRLARQRRDAKEFYSQGPEKVLPKLMTMKKASKGIENFSGKNKLSDEEIDNAIEYVNQIKKGSVAIMNYQGRTLDPEGPAYSGSKKKNSAAAALRTVK